MHITSTKQLRKGCCPTIVRKYFLTQKWIGLGMYILSSILLSICPIFLITGVYGLILLFSKKSELPIYGFVADYDPDEEELEADEELAAAYFERKKEQEKLDQLLCSDIRLQAENLAITTSFQFPPVVTEPKYTGKEEILYVYSKPIKRKVV